MWYWNVPVSCDCITCEVCFTCAIKMKLMFMWYLKYLKIPCACVMWIYHFVTRNVVQFLHEQITYEMFNKLHALVSCEFITSEYVSHTFCKGDVLSVWREVETQENLQNNFRLYFVFFQVCLGMIAPTNSKNKLNAAILTRNSNILLPILIFLKNASVLLLMFALFHINQLVSRFVLNPRTWQCL